MKPSNEEVTEALNLMRPFYNEFEMKVLDNFMSRISSLEEKVSGPDTDTTMFAYTIAFNSKKMKWLSLAHVGDGEPIESSEGVTEIDAFINLMMKL